MRQDRMIWLINFYIATVLDAYLPPTLPSLADWWKAICRGTKLSAAMQFSESQASTFLTPLNSPWDGGLYQELADWGYTEGAREQLCDFDQIWHMKYIFDFYRMNSKPWYLRGDNACFDVFHGDLKKKKPNGDTWPLEEQTYTVAGKKYSATGAFATIGINIVAGHMFFISRKSAGFAATQLWGQKPSNDDLPALKAQSDIAWGFWNRVNSVHTINNIEAFWTVEITNKETNAIINQAHQTYSQNNNPSAGRTLVWPGVSFEIDALEGQAILGSPNGIAAAYFLAQHKRQLGGNKMIYRITVFRAKEEDTLSNMIFWVRDVPKNPFGDATSAELFGVDDRNNISFPSTETRSLKTISRYKDQKEVIREHVFRAEL